MKPQDRTRAILRSGLKPLERLLLIAICDYASAHGEAWPSIPTLVDDTGMGRSTVIRTLKALEGRGLQANRTPGRSTHYHFDLDSLPPKGCQSGTGVRAAPVPERDPGGVRAGPPPVSERDGGGVRAGPEATNKRPIEATIEATKENGAASEPLVLDSPPVAQKPKKRAKRQPSKAEQAALQEAEQGVDLLRTVRMELHRQATGKEPRSTWAQAGTRPALVKRVKRFLAEVRRLEIGEPLAVLQALARWIYLAPDAEWWRRQSEPLDKALGGHANSEGMIKRQDRAQTAWEWHQAGEPSNAPRAARHAGKSRGHPSFAQALREEEDPKPPARQVVNDPAFPFSHPIH